jgi:elongation factor Ts
MTKVTASQVNDLRKPTGAGMMDCKNALVEAEGNFDKAVEILRKKGQKVAAKRADRESSEGVAISITNSENTSGVGIVLACETDFVGKNADFIDLAHKIAIIGLKCDSKESLLKENLEEMSVEDKLIEQTGVIGEKIQINDFVRIDAAYVGTYIHAGNKISSLVGFSDKSENIETAGKDIAMQIAAMNPIALDESSVDSNVIEKEIEIAKDQLRKEGKPEEMLENIAKGKLKKFFKENTLINQQFIKDSKVSISQYLKSHSDSVKVTGFSRVGLV